MKRAKVTAAAWLVLGLVPCLVSAASADLRKLYATVIQTSARKHNIDPDLVHVIIRAESNYDNYAISDKGAMGLMQLMPATAQQYGVRNVFDPAQNIEGGVRYLGDLIRLFQGQTKLVLAAYNAGHEAVKKYRGIPPYPETKAYIAGIMQTYTRATIRATKALYRGYDARGKRILTTDPALVKVRDD